MSSRPRFFTGIQPTGTLTLGHYLGVIRHILTLQEEYEVIIMIADLHALTAPNKEINYQEKAYEIAALLYACGLKEDCKIFIQSQIKEHSELAYLLSPHLTVSALTNMIQYKEKKKNAESGNVALLNYPVLMAADIFLYEPDLVIVGQDQKQHLELATHLSQKFNNFYEKELLKLPNFTIPRLGAKIMGLRHPERKMSKSENDHIALKDKPEIIEKKIMEATTDSENKIYYDPNNKEKAGISNLITIYALLKTISIPEAEEVVKNFNYDKFKREIIKTINLELEIIQKNFVFYQEKVKSLLAMNRNYLQDFAEKKVRKIKEFIHLP